MIFMSFHEIRQQISILACMHSIKFEGSEDGLAKTVLQCHTIKAVRLNDKDNDRYSV